MPEARKRPCTICRRWFRPNPRVGDRQRACGRPQCQTARRKKTQADWRDRNPGYGVVWRIDERATGPEAPEPLRLPAPLNQLPGDFAKDQFGPQGADFIGLMGALVIRTAKDQILPYLIDPAGVPRQHFPLLHAKDQFRSSAYSTPAGRPCNWSFTNSIAGGSICGCASRTASASYWHQAG